MGSLHEGGKGIGASLGGLVWVRRRNGRWWPGRILGPDELPESLPSPKSGTAVKLLGREDASVDWYNVEKSTRIKAFRCGEYDECIEKASVTAANSSKKLLKYASKEDAILHALRIERACLGKDHPGSNSKMTKQGHKVKDSPRLFRHNGEEINNVDKDSSNSEDKSDSAQEMSLSSVSFEDPSYIGPHKEHTLGRTSNDSEDYGTKGVDHMKGVKDPDTPVLTSSKRKRFQVAHVHEFLKRKHNRPTATKKLESNILVTVPVYEKLAHPTRSLPQGASTSKVSGLFSDLPKINFPLRDNDGTSDDGLYDIPIVTEEQHCADLRSLVYNTSERARVSGGTKSNESSQVETVSLGESGSTSSCTAEVNCIIQGVDDDAILKWQLKGKRSMHTNKNRKSAMGKFTDLYDEFDAYVAGAECSVDHDTLSGSQPSDNDNSRHPLKSRVIANVKIDEDPGWNGNTSHQESRDSQASAELHAPHGESRFSMNSNYQDLMIRRHTAEYLLFDVDLEVKSNYRPQHVPYVSLTSKLTGQSIIGHPLTVDILEHGFCQNLASDLGEYSSSCELGEELGFKLDLEATSNSVGRGPRKHTLQNGTPSKSRKYGLLSKKIRKLSSLPGARGQSKEKKLIVEKVRGPSLACLPLTIVFSRLNEALNCPNRPMRRQ